ncbi:MAG: hypothetical protein DVS81_14530 [Candidatus Accumulibacter meliphilus]|uniref:Type II toxin-antitoxin system HigB family toxin n=1 Tax=Candidatus Accumulibacter meliphilus TaxID=2211374 RepID=A0A369XKH5_9PROT|nr:MAG: hypothetical protein DVS81_14530 [Candidatus Accumulibacter meliphilus]
MWIVTARYQNGIVMVEWIGTHAEYDKPGHDPEHLLRPALI